MNKFEKRLAVLECQVAEISERLNSRAKGTKAWWLEVAGVFKNDPAFEEASKLGRDIRESTGPRKLRGTKGRNGHSRH